jgi:hypothetical protein
MKINSKIVETRKVEIAINIIMGVLAVFAVFVFVMSMKNPYFTGDAVTIELFIIILIAILAQTAILTKLLEKLM